MSDPNCKKCGGTGRLPWTKCDGGACWACTGRYDTSYAYDTEAQDAYVAELNAEHAARRAARRERRSVAP